MEIKEANAHIDSMLLQTRQNHMRLTAMTDQKAHILIAISAITLNVSASQLDNPMLKWPLLILLVQAVVTMFLASLVIMPTLRLFKGGSKPEKLHSSFATSFASLNYNEYIHLLEQAFQNNGELYEIMARELYDSAQIVVNKKFRLLRYAFISFLSGLVVTLIAFVITVFAA